MGKDVSVRVGRDIACTYQLCTSVTVLLMAFLYLCVYTVKEKYFYKCPAFWPVHFFHLRGFCMCGVF